MKTIILFFILIHSAFAANETNDSANPSIGKHFNLNQALVERYILDDLRSLWIAQQALKTYTIEKLASNKIEINDRALDYTNTTLSSIFYIITIAATLLVVLGLRSFRDVKSTVDKIVSKKIGDITEKYEIRLNEMEHKIKARSDEIIFNQEEIANTNLVHSLWMRSGLEKSNREKIKLYDQILEIKPDDVDAITYKADVLLDIDKVDEALKLTNVAIAKNPKYALAYWQRACAYANLSLLNEAIADIKKAIEISQPLKNKINNEVHFETLKHIDEFKSLMQD